MARTRHYQHFCPVARSLEVIGEKWSLLIVRDLLGGDRRFTDLLRGLSSITPKWLTLRLRELEEAGIVERVHEEGKREVWYRLTPEGRELSGVVSELNAWGLRHAMRPPGEDEAVGEGRFGRSLLSYLLTRQVQMRSPKTWRIDFSPKSTGWFTFDGDHWSRVASEAPAVTVHTSPHAWATVLGLSGEERRAGLEALEMTGAPEDIREFVDVMTGIASASRRRSRTNEAQHA